MPGTGFSKEQRLTKPAEFKAVFSHVKYKVPGGALLVFAIKNELASARLGLIIAKKHISTAVQRNRIKRILRASFRLNQDLLVGIDIVILARGDLGLLDNKQLHILIQKLWLDLVKKLPQNSHQLAAKPSN